MKNYDEITNDLLERRDQYETEQRNKRKVMKRTIMPICCFCLVALLGLGLWQGDFFESTKPIKMEDSTIVGEKDYVEPDKNNQTSNAGDVIGMVKYNGANYVQCSTSVKAYTPHEYLGEAYNFEGTYQTYLRDVAGGLYITKEDPNVLMVELKNGEYNDYVILIKEQNQSNSQG